jgi:hypothetical protein
MSDLPPNGPSTGSDQTYREESAPSLLPLLRDQQARWRQGERVLVEEYLARQPALAANPEAALDLIVHEALLRRERGEKAELEEYLQRFPQWAAQLQVQFEVEAVLAGATSVPTKFRPEETGTTSAGFPPPPAAMPQWVAGYRVLGSWAGAAWAWSSRPASPASTAWWP